MSPGTDAKFRETFTRQRWKQMIGEDETTWQYPRGVAGTDLLYWVIFVIVACTIGTALLWGERRRVPSLTCGLTGSRKGLSNMVVAFSLRNAFGRTPRGMGCPMSWSFSFGAPRSVFAHIRRGPALCVHGGASRAAREPRRHPVMFSAVGVGLAEGTVLSSWTAIVRRSLGAERFGLNPGCV